VEVGAEGPRRGAATRPRGPERAAVGAGVVAAIAFPVVVLWDGATRADGYDPARHWISLLSLGSRAALGRASLFAAGLALAAAGVGLARLAGDRPAVGRAGGSPSHAAWSLVVLGVALLVAAVFPIDAVASYPMSSGPTPLSPTGFVHGVAGCVIIVASAAACWFGAAAIGERSRWAVATARLVVAVVLLASSASLVVAAWRKGNWEQADAGLFQRVSLFSALAWIAAFGVVVLRDGAVLGDGAAPRDPARPREGRAGSEGGEGGAGPRSCRPRPIRRPWDGRPRPRG
jgi:hypothetical protein